MLVATGQLEMQQLFLERCRCILRCVVWQVARPWPSRQCLTWTSLLTAPGSTGTNTTHPLLLGNNCLNLSLFAHTPVTSNRYINTIENVDTNLYSFTSILSNYQILSPIMIFIAELFSSSHVYTIYFLYSFWGNKILYCKTLSNVLSICSVLS